MTEGADAADDKAALFAAERAKRRAAPAIEGHAAPDPDAPDAAEPDGPRPVSEDAVAAPDRDAAADAPAAAAREPFSADASSPAREASSRPSRILPLVVGVVIGAAAAAGGAYAISSFGLGQPAPDTSQTDALRGRLDALDRRVTAAAALGPRVDALARQIAAVPPPVDVAPLDKRLDAIEAAAAEKPVAAPAPAPVDLSPLADRLGALETKVAGLPTKADLAARPAAAAAGPGLAGDVKSLAAKVDALGARIAPLEALANPKTDVRAPQDRDAAATLQATRGPDLAAVSADLARRIADGRAFDDDVALLAMLGADPAKIARLRPLAAHGVPATADLVGQFGALAASLAAAADPDPAPGEGLLAHLERSAGALVRVRKVDDTGGGQDLASRVARVQGALGRGDVPAAYASWQSLPEAAKAKSAAWGRAAEAHVAALAIARGLDDDAVALIGKGRP